MHDLNKLDNWDINYLDTIRPLVAPLLHSGCYSLGPLSV